MRMAPDPVAPVITEDPAGIDVDIEEKSPNPRYKSARREIFPLSAWPVQRAIKRLEADAV